MSTANESDINPRRAAPPPATGVNAGAPLPTAADALAATLEGPKTDGTGVGGVKADHVFTLDHVDQRGHRWQGQFACHVLTLRDRIRTGVVRARLLGGVSPESIDASTVGLAEQLAHLTVALDRAPDWFKNLEEFREPSVLAKVYEEVASHEERFHRSGPGGSGGAAGS